MNPFIVICSVVFSELVICNNKESFKKLIMRLDILSLLVGPEDGFDCLRKLTSDEERRVLTTET